MQREHDIMQQEASLKPLSVSFDIVSAEFPEFRGGFREGPTVAGPTVDPWFALRDAFSMVNVPLSIP
jgi:hypothetical protein